MNWKAHPIIRHCVTAVLAVAAAVLPLCLSGCTTVVGGRQRPLVRVDDVKASLEYNLDHQSDDRKSAGSSFGTETTLMEELLNLQAKGDVFDPKLMSYNALLGFGLSQQKYDSDTLSGSDNGDLQNYGFSASFLPTKMYPFSIEAVQTDSLIPRAFQGPLRVEDSHEGFNMRLRVPDWPMFFSWSRSDLNQRSDVVPTEDVFERKSERFSYTLTHDFSEYSHLIFRSDIDALDQTSGSFENDFDTQRHRLEHDYEFGEVKQHSLDSTFIFFERQDQFDTKTFDWTENLVLRHTPDFTTFYNTIFSDSTFNDTDVQTITGLGGFIHKMYSNLTTQGEVFASKSEFGSISETTSQGGRVNLDYFRNNPWGIFLMELEFDITKDKTTGDTGESTVINEVHVFNDPFPFRLNERNIDITSILITDVTGAFVYSEGDDYMVAVIGNQVEITATPLGNVPPNIVDGQTLLVDYNYEIVGDLEEETFGQLFRIEQKFNNGLSVYFSHLLQDRNVDSDINPDLSDDDTETNLYGIEYRYRRLTFIAEHRETDSTFQSSESDRLAASVYWPLTSKTTLWGSVSNTWIDTFGEDTSRDSTLFRVEGKIRTRLSPNLRVSGRVEYRNEDDSDLGPTDGYRIGSSLDYERGSLRLRAGWDTYFLERRNTESESTRFFLDLARFF